MSHVPAGLHSVTPYLVVTEADAFLEFLQAAFGAEVGLLSRAPDGRLTHAEVRIAGSVVEVGEARPGGEVTRTALHVFVPDPDAAYERALAAGAESVYAMADHDYGERSGGVRDRWGNSWYLAAVTDPVKRSGG